MSLETHRQHKLFEWLGERRRVSSYGTFGDVADPKERETLALWLDKEYGDFLSWCDEQDHRRGVVLERTDYVNSTFTIDGEAPRLEAMPTPAAFPPPAKGTHESDLFYKSNTWGPIIAHLPGTTVDETYDAARAWSQS